MGVPLMFNLDQGSLHDFMRRWNIVNIDCHDDPGWGHIQLRLPIYRVEFAGMADIESVRHELMRLTERSVLLIQTTHTWNGTIAEYRTSYQRLRCCPACGELVEDVDHHAKGIEDLMHIAMLINAA